ncbi:hypothetical protein AGR3A_Cc260212 [Agrobacterium tomkonis CFBP 6623]|uniref:Uncharacterized protein n=1 Tax=Agrobacterium tomkonis CFBP 6623 TaxID=1183432 RepID=A0A1S7PKX9_9HYPH|nr:hypothetical protein AGR3A_Cc260212 [Agrobacterium tomkonis CFBP 6623]
MCWRAGRCSHRVPKRTARVNVSDAQSSMPVFASSIARSYLRYHAVKAGPAAPCAQYPPELLRCHFTRMGRPLPDGNRKFAAQYQQ